MSGSNPLNRPLGGGVLNRPLGGSAYGTPKRRQSAAPDPADAIRNRLRKAELDAAMARGTFEREEPPPELTETASETQRVARSLGDRRRALDDDEREVLFARDVVTAKKAELARYEQEVMDSYRAGKIGTAQASAAQQAIGLWRKTHDDEEATLTKAEAKLKADREQVQLEFQTYGDAIDAQHRKAAEERPSTFMVGLSGALSAPGVKQVVQGLQAV